MAFSWWHSTIRPTVITCYSLLFHKPPRCVSDTYRDLFLGCSIPSGWKSIQLPLLHLLMLMLLVKANFILITSHFSCIHSDFHRPANAVEHCIVWGKWWLWLRPEASSAVGPELSALSAVLSHGEGCGENEPCHLLSHCELRRLLTSFHPHL